MTKRLSEFCVEILAEKKFGAANEMVYRRFV